MTVSKDKATAGSRLTMKLIVPLVTILLLTSTLSLTACGKKKQQSSEEATSSQEVTSLPKATSSQQTNTEIISAVRAGVNGEYDQSGLAKRVAKALAQHPELAGISTIYVAQTESTIILKGTVPNQTSLDKIVSVAKTVKGVTGIETSQVKVKGR